MKTIKNLKTKIYETTPAENYCDNKGQILNLAKILDKLKTYKIDITKDKESTNFMEKIGRFSQQKNLILMEIG